MNKGFDAFFLMDTDSVRRYAVEVLQYFAPDERLQAEEIGDGNINYVFRVRSEDTGRSVIVKQADTAIRSSGNPLDIYRNKIEAHILMLEGELAPGFVPEVYKYDETMAATSMEDVSAFRNLRKELMAGRVYPHLADNIAAFAVDTLLPTTDLVLPAEEKKRRVQFYTNPALCRITEDLVLTEPWYDYRHRNILTPGNEDFVREHLYQNEELQAEVGYLRERFMNDAQALLHGDLHSGSIFANADGIRVLDPEFAFYGPMGYDIGNVTGNLVFAWAYHHFAGAALQSEDSSAAAAAVTGKTANDGATDAARNELPSAVADSILRLISDYVDLVQSKMEAKYLEMVTFPFYQTETFRRRYLDSITADAFGYAGTEIIRRTVGDSKVREVESVQDPAIRIAMERFLIRLGSRFIMERDRIRTGAQTAALIRELAA